MNQNCRFYEKTILLKLIAHSCIEDKEQPSGNPYRNVQILVWELRKGNS